MSIWTKEQMEAIEKDGTNIIVSAGAGSGKTAVLSERVIRKLNDKIDVNRLLILTFTKASAKEMKMRIKSKIEQDKSLANQLELLNSAYITTFDSYAYSIVKKYHYLLNISNDIKIEEGNIINIKKRKIIDNIFDNLYEEENEKFLKFIYTYCLKDDKEIKSLIIKLSDKLDLKYDKLDYLNNYISKYYSEEKINEDVNKYLHLIKRKQLELDELIDTLSEYDINTYVIKLREQLDIYINSEDYEEIKKISSVEIPRLPNNSGASDVKKSISNIKDDIVKLCHYKSVEEMKSLILETKDYVEVIVDIIINLEKEISKYKIDNEIFTFNDIAKYSISLVKNNEEIRLEIKKYFNEIMIDEYQDTSDLQDEFIKCIENNNVYMVGDIKQSIYRFRNANPYIFKKKYDLYKNNIGGYKIDLNKNFRSRKETLDNINLIFNLIMEDEIGGANYIKEHQMVFGNNTYLGTGNNNIDNNIEILNYELEDNTYSKTEVEIFAIGKDILNRVKNKYQVMDSKSGNLRDIKNEDIVILMDKSKDFVLYKKIFEYLGIPLSIYRDDNITDNINIVLIKNIISLSNLYKQKKLNEEFKHNFLSIGRSYLFEYSDYDLFEMIKNNNYKSILLDKIKEVSILLDKYSISYILNQIISIFNIEENMIKIGNIEENKIVIDYISNLSIALESIGYNIYDFSDYLNDLLEYDLEIKMSLNNINSDSVKIMTIHGSKGLEYPICYYSGLSNNFNIRELNDKILLDDNIIIPVYNNGYRNTIYKELLKDKYLKEEVSEKIRLFYVALTRAREKLIVVASLKENNMLEDKSKYRSFKDILCSTKEHIEDYITNIELDSLNITKNYKINNKVEYSSTDDNVIVVKELVTENIEKESLKFSKNKINLLSKEEVNNMKLGIKVHEILEVIDFNNPDFSNIDDFYVKKIKKLLNSFLFNNVINIYKEEEFMYEDDNKIYRGIIDLVIEYEDSISIVDYKLKHTEDEAYLKQLNGYKNYISKISNKKIELYLYSILDEEIIKL